MDNKIAQIAIIENCIIYVCTAAMVLGLYAMSSSFHSLWALVMLSFVNHFTKK